MIDTHCHLDFKDFDHDRQKVLASCREKGVSTIIIPAVSAATFDKTIQSCAHDNSLKFALGLHPFFIEEHQPQDLLTLDQLVEKTRPIAIGEIGLDFFEKNLIEPSLKEKQIAFFSKQLIIAKHHDLPVIIHNRKAHDECIQLLKEAQLKGGIIHAFNGSIQHAEKYIELGFLLGFGGMLTFERSTKLRALAKKIPLSAMVLETDAPDMAVIQHKGERNSPEYIPYICDALAEIKQVPATTIDKVTSENARRVLALW